MGNKVKLTSKRSLGLRSQAHGQTSRSSERWEKHKFPSIRFQRQLELRQFNYRTNESPGGASSLHFFVDHTWQCIGLFDQLTVQLL